MKSIKSPPEPTPVVAQAAPGDAVADASANLQRLLGDLDVREFIASVFGKRWVHLRPPQAVKAGDLVTLRELELLLFDIEGTARVNSAGGPAAGPGGAHSTTRSADEAIDDWEAGKTLIFNGIDRKLPQLDALARGLEGELKCRVGCNLYLTPADGRGFEAHYDSHDVFVLQLIGSKDWRLGGVAASAPMSFQHHERITIPDDSVQSNIRLMRGDTLYIPRGVSHEAVTADELSCHLTIGLYPKTVLDLLLTALMIEADTDPRFREYLPIGRFTPDEPTIQTARSLLTSLSDNRFREAGDAFCEDLASERRRSTIGLLSLQGEAKGQLAQSRFRATPHLMSSLTVVADTIELNAMGKLFVFPAIAAADIALCCSGQVFAASDLRSLSGDEQRLELVRRLLFGGVIERLESKTDSASVTVDIVHHGQAT